jgi:hypothetical protein
VLWGTPRVARSVAQWDDLWVDLRADQSVVLMVGPLVCAMAGSWVDQSACTMADSWVVWRVDPKVAQKASWRAAPLAVQSVVPRVSRWVGCLVDLMASHLVAQWAAQRAVW